MSATATPAGAGATYERDRAYVLSVLRRRCGWLEPDERESILHDAYVVLLQKQHDGDPGVPAMDERQRRAYLTQTALNKALDEGKRARRTREQGLEDAAFAYADQTPGPDDLATARQTSAQVREVVAELPERRQLIVKLRFFYDRTPEEIQTYMGISERVYRRELERAIRQLADSVDAVRQDRWCEERRSSILALVAGVAGPRRAQRAREHLATCPTCARWAVSVRDQARAAAALLPLPAVTIGGWGERIGRAFETVAGHLSSAKQHALEAAARVDAARASYVSAVRPGTLAAAVAGCIALGGGATYCVVEGVPKPLRTLVGVVTEKPKRPVAKPRPQASNAGAAASTSGDTVTSWSGQANAPGSSPSRDGRERDTRRDRRASRPRSMGEAVDREFGLEGAGTPVSGHGGGSQPSAGASGSSTRSVQTPVSPSPKPSPMRTPAPSRAPAPGGGGEFDP